MTSGVESAPDECPWCACEEFYPFSVATESKSKLMCANCGYKYHSGFAARELSRDATCYDYDCHGELELVEPELYRCADCGRFNGVATTSNGGVYPASICPLCLTLSPSNIDFHHWEYENETGVYICRECHNRIHDGKRAREQSRDLPDGETWHVPAGNNLVAIHEDNHGKAESWDDFFDRYNLPEDHPMYADLRSLKL